MQWSKYFNQLWYDPFKKGSFLFTPLSVLYQAVVALRRRYYQRFKRHVTTFKIPVIVVGNLTVGGTGKTPFVIWLAHFLRTKGYRPGIVSRGYGGSAPHYPQVVTAQSNPLFVGDEAVLIARATGCPVVVDPKRVNAVTYLLSQQDCNIILSDDGLQHYALGRDIEIVMIDGNRWFGNEKCLPAGPLREPLSRLDTVDFIVVNGKTNQNNLDGKKVYPMALQAGAIYNLAQPELTATPHDFTGQVLHAVAGIGHPYRFFQLLRDLGLTVWPHSFPDHYQFMPKDLEFEADAKIIMTEKDAVKCEQMIDYRYWCLPVTAELNHEFEEALLAKICQMNK